MIFMVINDDQLECEECGEVHEFLTRSVGDNCAVPALFDFELMDKLLSESPDGKTFLGGRPISVPLMDEEEVKNAD